MYFDNNTAVEGGSDLHGRSVDNCKINTFIFNKHYEDSTALCGYYFDAIIGNKTVISSDPLNICTCRDGVTNCSGSSHAEFPCKDLQGSCKSLQFSCKIEFARNFLQDNGTFPLNLV